MNKKKRIAILFAVILVVAVGIIIAVTSHQKKEMDFDEFADRFEKSAEEVLGEDVKKVAKTELAATLTYGDQTDKDRTIYYRILKTTFYDGDPAEITGLHTEALGVLFPVDSMDSCEEMMIKDWHGALYKKDDKAFLCWTLLKWLKALRSKNKKVATICTPLGECRPWLFALTEVLLFLFLLFFFLLFLSVDIQNRFNRPFGNQQFFFLFSDLTVLSVVLLFLDCQLMKLLI